MNKKLGDAINTILSPSSGTVVSFGFGGDIELAKHGHVLPREDGFRARCGGPSICRHCATELSELRGKKPTTRDVEKGRDG